MKKKNMSFAAKSFIALALSANLTAVPLLVRAQQDTTTVCQVSYTSAPPVPWLAPSPFNVIIQGGVQLRAFI
jgi:hypothetical protein